MTTDRTEFTRGLRALADLLDADPSIRLPYQATTEYTFSWGVHGMNVPAGQDVPTALVDLARKVIPGTRTKDVRDGYYYLNGTLSGLRLQVWGMREQVCERVVTGTREVTREVRDPAALAAVPTTVVTETVEDVEWICAPLGERVTA